MSNKLSVVQILTNLEKITDIARYRAMTATDDKAAKWVLEDYLEAVNKAITMAKKGTTKGGKKIKY